MVIGETCVIGRGVRLYQGVTLGAKSFPLDADGKPIKASRGHPIVEDDVIIYSGATVLGRITIGRGSVIGGNVWLTHSVPPRSRVQQGRLQESTTKTAAASDPSREEDTHHDDRIHAAAPYAIAGSMLELVGNTPLVRLPKLSAGLPGEVVAKLEFFNVRQRQGPPRPGPHRGGRGRGRLRPG